jgi:hypothetical protein
VRARWIRDRGLGLLFVSLFAVSWIAQLVVEWFSYADEQQTHGEDAIFWSTEFWAAFWQSTLENWQSEFLQLGAFVIASAYFVYKGSSESPDGDERLEAKIDALLRAQGLDPDKVDDALPELYRSLPNIRAEHKKASEAAQPGKSS